MTRHTASLKYLSTLFNSVHTYFLSIFSFKVLLLLTTPKAGELFRVLDIHRRNMGSSEEILQMSASHPLRVTRFLMFTYSRQVPKTAALQALSPIRRRISVHTDSRRWTFCSNTMCPLLTTSSEPAPNMRVHRRTPVPAHGQSPSSKDYMPEHMHRGDTDRTDSTAGSNMDSSETPL